MVRKLLIIVAALLIVGELAVIKLARVKEPDDYILREVVADYVYAQIIHYVTVNAKYPESIDDLVMSHRTKKLAMRTGLIYEKDKTFGFNLMIPGPTSAGRLWDVRGARLEEP